MTKPRPQASALDQHTPLYLDMYCAIKELHMLYHDYMARTTPQERLANRLFLALHGAKETHAMDRAQAEADAARAATRAVTPPGTSARM